MSQRFLILLHTRAYSLLELLIVIALFGIVLFVAIPAWRPTLQNGTTVAQTAKVVALIEYARILAVKRGHNIALCRRLETEPKGDWSAGQVVKDMQNKDILKTVAAVPSQNKLLWKSSFSDNNCLTFTPLGVPNGQQGSFYYCHEGASAGIVVVQETGNVYVNTLSEKESKKACI